MVTRKDYVKKAVEAAKSVLIELSHLLGEYQENIVIIGGWVPELVIPQEKQKHTGSIDVDIAINHKKISEPGYKTILELLLSHGYRQGPQPFIFLRDVPVGDEIYEVEVDLMAGEYAGTGKSHRHQRIFDSHARKGRGIDLVFTDPEKILISGRLPGGGKDSVTVQVSSIPVFIIMKCIALDKRLKEKDAWDIYYCVRNYPGGIEILANKFSSITNHSLTKEAVIILSTKFSSPEDIGPRYVADFEEVNDSEQRLFIQRDAYERMTYLIERIQHLLE